MLDRNEMSMRWTNRWNQSCAPANTQDERVCNCKITIWQRRLVSIERASVRYGGRTIVRMAHDTRSPRRSGEERGIGGSARS
jgi:hypothetical protein